MKIQTKTKEKNLYVLSSEDVNCVWENEEHTSPCSPLIKEEYEQIQGILGNSIPWYDYVKLAIDEVIDQRKKQRSKK